MTTLTISPDQERIIRGIGAGIVIYTVAGATIGAAAAGWRFMAGALVGGGLMWLNFSLLVRLIRGLLASTVAGRFDAKWYAVKIALVELAVFGAVAAVVAVDVVSVIGFLIGLLSLLGGVAGVGLAWRIRAWKRTRGAESAESAQ
jgi:hypothetical protein